MAEKIITDIKTRNLLREYRFSFTMNEQENKALNRYFEQYRVQNKSKFVRETVMYAIIRKMEEDSPTLFD